VTAGPQNIHGDPAFFAGYAALRESEGGLKRGCRAPMPATA